MDFIRIRSSFPNIKLCYDKISHNKVSKVCMLIPYGIKCFVWFTKYNNVNTCFILELFNKKINKIYPIGFQYNSSLCNGEGTILYGTIFMNYKYKLKMIAIEDIFYLNEKINNTHEEKLEIIYRLFKEKIKSKKVLIGFPIMLNSNDIGDTLDYDDYKVQYVQYRENETNMIIPFKVFEKKEKKGNQQFYLQYSGQTEIYNLLDKDTREFIDIAFIPSYTTSIAMKRLFQKSVKKLEEYEESDDEEEESKKEILMKCEFNDKFQKWVPILKIY